MIQPVGSVYVICADPASTPLTVPVPDMVALATGVPVQVPPVEVVVKLMVDATQTAPGPVMAAGSGFTVMVAVT